MQKSTKKITSSVLYRQIDPGTSYRNQIPHIFPWTRQIFLKTRSNWKLQRQRSRSLRSGMKLELWTINPSLVEKKFVESWPMSNSSKNCVSKRPWRGYLSYYLWSLLFSSLDLFYPLIFPSHGPLYSLVFSSVWSLSSVSLYYCKKN